MPGADWQAKSTPARTFIMPKIFQLIANLFRKPKTPAASPSASVYEIAMGYLGVQEVPGKKHNPIILGWLRAIGSWIHDDETAWCSTFANYCALLAGLERSHKLNARSWLNVGEPVNLEDAQRGDVVILWRVSPKSSYGHVAFFESYTPRYRLVRLLGGNQNDEVNISPYDVGRILGIRRLRPAKTAKSKP